MNGAITQVSKEFIDDAIEKMIAGDKNLRMVCFGRSKMADMLQWTRHLMIYMWKTSIHT